MLEIQDLVLAAVAILAAIPVAYFTATRKIASALTDRLAKVSGGRVKSIEDLVAHAIVEENLRRKTDIKVYGDPRVWADLRRAGFKGARMANGDPTLATVAVVDVASVSIEAIGDDPKNAPTGAVAEGLEAALIQEPYVLIFKEGAPYRGPLPPGAFITYANTPLTVDARLMEALRHHHALEE